MRKEDGGGYDRKTQEKLIAERLQVFDCQYAYGRVEKVWGVGGSAVWSLGGGDRETEKKDCTRLAVEAAEKSSASCEAC